MTNGCACRSPDSVAWPMAERTSAVRSGVHQFYQANTALERRNRGNKCWASKNLAVPVFSWVFRGEALFCLNCAVKPTRKLWCTHGPLRCRNSFGSFHNTIFFSFVFVPVILFFFCQWDGNTFSDDFGEIIVLCFFFLLWYKISARCFLGECFSRYDYVSGAFLSSPSYCNGS